jgi:hypothetical protein
MLASLDLGLPLGRENHRRRRADGSANQPGRNARQLWLCARPPISGRASHHRGRVAARAGVGPGARSAGINAAKSPQIARARAPATDKTRWRRRDGICLLSFRSTFPISHSVHSDRRREISAAPLQCCCPWTAVRVRIAFGRWVGFRPWGTGLSMVAAGAVLVGVAMKAVAAPAGHLQRGSVVGFANFGCADLCSAAATENVTYAVHPSSRFLALNSE